MKKILAIPLSVLILAACAMHPGDAPGSLTITAPRGALTDANGNPYTMRYGLRKDGAPVLLDNRKYTETTGSDTFTIDNLATGDGYALSLSIGVKTGNNLAVKYYGTTAPFSIASGTTTDVSLALANVPINYTFLTTSGSRSSVAKVGTTMYVLDGNSLKSFDSDPSAITTDIESLDTYGTVNSLSTGKYFSDGPADELWVNTSRGLWRNNDGLTHSLNGSTETNILFSKAANVNGEIAAVYSGGKASVGMIVASMQSELDAAWKTVSDVSDLKDYIADITKDVVTGIGVNNEYLVYYVSTAVGTVIGNSSITSINELLSIKSDPGNSHWLKAGTEEIPIKVVSSASDLVFAGTNSGVYYGAIDSSGVPTNPPLALVPGTSGLKIVSIDSIYSNSNEAVFTAAVTDQDTVLIFENANLVRVLDAAIGIPESATPLFWTEAAAPTLHLTLAGSNGAIDFTPAVN